MRYLLTVLLLCLSVTASAETMKADAAFGVKYNPTELKLNYLPDTTATPYVTIFGHGPRYEQLVKSYSTNPELKRLKDSSHFAAIDTASTLFKERYAASTNGSLVIRIQDANGNVLHEVADGNIPLSAEALIRQTNSAQCFGRRRCPDGNCPAPLDPDAQPLPPPGPAHPQSRFPWSILLGLTAVGAGLGVVKEWKSLYFNRK
jgi:hypothetical protein